MVISKKVSKAVKEQKDTFETTGFQLQKDFYEEMKKRFKTQNYVCIINFINSQMVIGNGNADILIVEIETKDYIRVKSFEKVGTAHIETNKFGNLNLLGGTLLK